MIKYDNNLDIFSSSLINEGSVTSGFSTKIQGNGQNIETLFNFFNNNKFTYKKIVVPEQIHSVNVSIFENGNNEKIEKINETDGVITKEKNVILTVITGDCCPAVFSDNKNGIVGISHQGWRGSVKRMVQKMIDKMLSVGAELSQIKVALGPTIGECCYDVDDDRYYEFREEFEDYSEKIFHTRSGRKHLNLTLLNYLLLLEKGVSKENIDHFPFCTRCDKKRFFSYRRDKKEEFGEIFSFIVKSV